MGGGLSSASSVLGCRTWGRSIEPALGHVPFKICLIINPGSLRPDLATIVQKKKVA